LWETLSQSGEKVNDDEHLRPLNCPHAASMSFPLLGRVMVV